MCVDLWVNWGASESPSKAQKSPSWSGLAREVDWLLLLEVRSQGMSLGMVRGGWEGDICCRGEVSVIWWLCICFWGVLVIIDDLKRNTVTLHYVWVHIGTFLNPACQWWTEHIHALPGMVWRHCNTSLRYERVGLGKTALVKFVVMMCFKWAL